MQSWQIKALEFEISALKFLDGYIHEHALYFLTGAIYLLLALLVRVLRGGLLPKGGKPLSRIRPAIVIHLTEPPPPPPELFDPLPPLRKCDCYHDHDEWTD